MDGAKTSAQLAFAAGFGPAGAKLLHDIANQMFGSATQEPEAYRWCPEGDKLLAIDAAGRRIYWEWLENGGVAVVDYDSGHRTTYPAGSLLSQIIPKKAMKSTHRPCMPPSSAVREEVRGVYFLLKSLAEAAFGPDNLALEYRWGVDRKFPGQLLIQSDDTGMWRRVEKKWNGSFAIHCEQTGTERTLPRKHPVAKLMNAKRSRNDGRGRGSYFEVFVEMTEAKGLYR